MKKQLLLSFILILSGTQVYGAAGKPEQELSFEEEKTRVKKLITQGQDDILHDAAHGKCPLAIRGAHELTHFFYATGTTSQLQKELNSADSLEAVQLVEQRRLAVDKLLINMIASLNNTGALLKKILDVKTTGEVDVILTSLDMANKN